MSSLARFAETDINRAHLIRFISDPGSQILDEFQKFLKPSRGLSWEIRKSLQRFYVLTILRFEKRKNVKNVIEDDVVFDDSIDPLFDYDVKGRNSDGRS